MKVHQTEIELVGRQYILRVSGHTMVIPVSIGYELILELARIQNALSAAKTVLQERVTGKSTEAEIALANHLVQLEIV